MKKFALTVFFFPALLAYGQTEQVFFPMMTCQL